MLAAPPWMKTSSGYFFDGSKFGGRKIMLWILRPPVLVKSKWIGGAQSMLAASAVSTLVRLAWVLAAGSMRTISCGLTELPKLAISIGLVAFCGMASAP